jgi:putative serine protease PepD
MSSPFEPNANEWPATYAHGPQRYEGPHPYQPQPAAAYGVQPRTMASQPYSMMPVVAPPRPPKPPRRPGRFIARTAAVLILTIGGGVVGAAGVKALDDRASTTKASQPTAVKTIANPATDTVASVVKAVDPVVVSITVTGAQETDEGSGIVLRSDGVILTNNHVISAAENGGTISVTFTDGTTAAATIVAADTQEDLAIVKATGVSGRATATLANSSAVQVGDTVVAIGNELGLSNSVSAGIVSALHRKVSVAAESNTPFQRSASDGTTYPNAIQTDASINEGDSGGALFNMAGEVIGIDSAIATASDGSSGSVGVGFAIAINDAKTFINANVTS